MTPNVVFIVADDLGFSDPGCYGGELRTPALDRMAVAGVRLAQFYTSARCSPSRASLLTSLHPHQVGLGILTNDDRPRGYPGTLAERCATLAELLAEAGYATVATGKWHLASDVRQPNEAWPARRGFDQFFGTLSGCGSYYDPPTLTRGDTPTCCRPCCGGHSRSARRRARGPSSRTRPPPCCRRGTCDSYCLRYRVAARSSNTPDSAAAHTGFRVARSLAA